MDVFLETARLLLRRFTTDDVDNLVELDSDPEVMLHITGGRTTTREEIENEVLPAFLGYYERFAGYGFWAVVEKSTGDFVGWMHFRPGRATPTTAGARVPAAEVVMGQGLRGRGVGRLDPQRVHRIRCAPCGGRDDGRAQDRAASWKRRSAPHPDVPPGWPDRIPGDELGDVESAITREEWERND